MKKRKVNPQAKKQIFHTLKVISIVVAIVIASGGIYFGVSIYQQVGGYDKEKLLNKEASGLYYAKTGEEYYSVATDGANKLVSYDEIPQVMIDAVVAAEDSRFFEHNGFDLPRIVKAFAGNLVAGGITSGGSTITQQVIKKSYYPDAQTSKENTFDAIKRKVGEIVLSIQATNDTTKEEILELYLNKIYFGAGPKTVGLYAASLYYFDKSVQNLTLPEAALLAGTLNSPTQFDPFNNLEKAQSRRNTILKLMRDHGYITAEECEMTQKIPVENTLKSNPISYGGSYQAYADMVIREVQEKTGLDPKETPMKIYTYMDKDLQKKLDDISNSKDYTFYDKDIQAGAVVQEATTGRITGVLSARNYKAMDSTNAYHKKGVKQGGYGNVHQPGSSLKPIIAYASAFEFLDYSTAHYVHDVPLDGTYSPKNHDGNFHGDLSIHDALGNSWNLAAIQTYLDVYREIGEDAMTEYLQGFGFDWTEEKLATGYAIGGWERGTTPKEEAGAYAVIANGGTYIEPHTVEKIEIIATGEVINIDEEAPKAKTEALSEESAFMIRSVMTEYAKSFGSYSGFKSSLQVGAKTGTSNYPRKDPIPSYLQGKSKDGWMSAYSPDYSWSVWVGYPESVAKEKKKYLKSSTDAKKISSIIANTIHDNGKPKNSYPQQPSGVVKGTCISGIYPYTKPGTGVPKDRIVSGYFKKENTPSGSASGAKLNDLSSFTASFVNKKIQVEFTEYNPKSLTEQKSSPTKQYKANGRTYTLPYLGDINQIYGRVVYVVEVADSTGKVVHTEKLNKPKATLNFTPGVGSYTVTGYYGFESNEGTSNKIQQPISVTGHLGASYSLQSTTANSIIVNLQIPQGNTVTVTIAGSTKEISSSGNIPFSTLSPNTAYTITFTEKTPDGQTRTLDPLEVRTLAQ